jgi:hypothetical protein
MTRDGEGFASCARIVLTSAVSSTSVYDGRDAEASAASNAVRAFSVASMFRLNSTLCFAPGLACAMLLPVILPMLMELSATATSGSAGSKNPTSNCRTAKVRCLSKAGALLDYNFFQARSGRLRRAGSRFCCLGKPNQALDRMLPELIAI